MEKVSAKQRQKWVSQGWMCWKHRMATKTFELSKFTDTAHGCQAYAGRDKLFDLWLLSEDPSSKRLRWKEVGIFKKLIMQKWQTPLSIVGYWSSLFENFLFYFFLCRALFTSFSKRGLPLCCDITGLNWPQYNWLNPITAYVSVLSFISYLPASELCPLSVLHINTCRQQCLHDGVMRWQHHIDSQEIIRL